jgi:uncharacterized protein (DUF1800 family)
MLIFNCQKMRIVFTFLLFCFFSDVYSQPYNDYLGRGHNQGIIVTTSNNSKGSSGQSTINGSGIDHKIFDASRFLAQATLGVKRPYIEQVANMGYEAWINDQFTKVPTLIVPKVNSIWDTLYTVQYNYREANGLDTDDIFGPYSLHFNYAWWDNNIKAEDLLRQRIALALSEILVLSHDSQLGDWARCLGSYYDIFVGDAFTTYKNILKKVTYHPAMGFYLSHLNNPKTNLATNLRPDQNYAREIKQLFTIGLYELNMDGTRKLDAQGLPIPTYDNDDIAEMSKIFTGLGPGEKEPYVWWSDEAYFGLEIYGTHKTIPMKIYPEQHEPGSKTLLKTHVTNASNSGDQDIEEAINLLINHPNTGPFIAKLLIQRLVKSNPSPAYVERVATAYYTPNAQGEISDMKNIIKAILLDPEARSIEAQLDPTTGAKRSPFVATIQFARTIDINSPRNTVNNQPTNLYLNNSFDLLNSFGQSVLASPTVFNFYPPDFSPLGDLNNLGLVAPEFKLHNSSKAISGINQVHGWTIWETLFWDWEGDDWYKAGNSTLNKAYLLQYAEDSEKLMHEIDKLLTCGQLSDQSKKFIRTALNSIRQNNYGSSWRDHRVRLALFLITISPDYVILK